MVYLMIGVVVYCYFIRVKCVAWCCCWDSAVRKVHTIRSLSPLSPHKQHTEITHLSVIHNSSFKQLDGQGAVN